MVVRIRFATTSTVATSRVVCRLDLRVILLCRMVYNGPRRAHAHVLISHTQANGKDSSSTSGQNTNQGWFNRFVQTGRSESETKTNGCFGGLQVVYSSTQHIVCGPFNNNDRAFDILAVPYT